MYIWRHIRAIMALPFMVCIVIPTILFASNQRFLPYLQTPPSTFQSLLGAVIFGSGLFLLGMSIKLFFVFGNGTLAPWDPPKKLVVRGIYRYSRNPMIGGVFLILLGEALFTGSILILVWFFLFMTIKMFYIHGHEYEELVEHFGKDYLEYARNVPAWIPRLTAWEQNSEVATSKVKANPYTKLI